MTYQALLADDYWLRRALTKDPEMVHLGLGVLFLVMRLEMQLRYAAGEAAVGDLVWDSEAGTLGGTMGRAVRSYAELAQRYGFVELPGPVPSYVRREVHDPLREPGDMAALIVSMGFIVPEVLASYWEAPVWERSEMPEGAVA